MTTMRSTSSVPAVRKSKTISTIRLNGDRGNRIEPKARRWKYLSTGGAALLMFAFCQFGGTTSAADDDRVPDDIAVVYNLRYREGTVKDWVLDLAMQKEYTGKPRPAIVVIHGGGWLEGDKSSFSTPKNRPPGNIIDFAKLGFVAVTMATRFARELVNFWEGLPVDRGQTIISWRRRCTTFHRKRRRCS